MKTSIPVVLVLLVCGGWWIKSNQLPPHVTRINGTPTPDPGYAWMSDPQHDLHVQWSPGSENSQHPHVLAGATEGQFVPALGYDIPDPSNPQAIWHPGKDLASQGYPHVLASATEGQVVTALGYDFTDTSKLQTAWHPGEDLTSQGYPHVLASATEGQLTPALGYGWTDPNNQASMQIVWHPGEDLTSQGYPHVLTSATEGQFVTALGYDFTDTSKLQTAWHPGEDLTSQGYPHVLASATEGQAVPEMGYHFTDPSKLQVALNDVGQPPEANGIEPQPVETEDQQNQRHFGDLLGAVIAKKLSEDQDGDSPVATNLGRPLAGVIADQFESDMKK